MRSPALSGAIVAPSNTGHTEIGRRGSGGGPRQRDAHPNHLSALLETSWLAGNLLVLLLLGLLVDRQLERQHVAHGPEHARSTLDIGEV